MTDRPFTTPEYPTAASDTGLEEPIVAGDTTSAYAEAQYAASPGSSTSTTSAKETAKETAATAKQEARTVAADAKESTRNVAATAKGEAKDVAAQTQQQARHLVNQLRTEVADQATSQSQRAAGGLRALADELSQMVSATQQQGVASDLARQGSDRARGFADWLEQREPGDILNEARDFARRRPGTFLAAAAAIGFLGGRMTKGLAADDESESYPSAGSAQRFGSTTPTYGGEPYAAETTSGTYGTAGTTGVTGASTGYSDRVDAGIDPATYSHPDPARQAMDQTGTGVSTGDGYGQEQR